MTLTEEQQEAIRAVSDLPRAIGCTRCHNYIQKNYSNQFAVLRSMIDNKDYVPNAAKLIELLAAGEHEQWADWAQSILDSEPGLSEGRKAAWPGMIATPYENLSEELKDKDRREVHLRSSVALDIVQQQAARIKELEDAHKRSGKKYAKIINELRSSVYANIPGLDVGKIGPDAKPRVWQITEERKAAIWHAVAVLKENDPDGEHLWDEEIAVLRAMLREAE